MRMGMPFHVLVGMPVGALVFAVDVGMRMGVGMLVGVNHAIMTVGVGMDMAVGVGVLQADGVFDHQPGGCRHDGKPQVEGKRRPFPQNQHTEGHADKWSNRVIGAGLGGAQL